MEKQKWLACRLQATLKSVPLVGQDWMLAMTDQQVLTIPVVLSAISLLLVAPSQWRKGRLRYPYLATAAWLGLILAICWVVERSPVPTYYPAGLFGFRVKGLLYTGYFFGPLFLSLGLLIRNRLQPPSVWGLAVIGVSAIAFVAIALLESREYPRVGLTESLAEYEMYLPGAAWAVCALWLAKDMYDQTSS